MLERYREDCLVLENEVYKSVMERGAVTYNSSLGNYSKRKQGEIKYTINNNYKILDDK